MARMSESQKVSGATYISDVVFQPNMHEGRQGFTNIVILYDELILSASGNNTDVTVMPRRLIARSAAD